MLVVTLFVMVVLSLLTLSLGYRASLEGRAVRHRVAGIQLQAQSRSAVAIALARLAADDNDFDHPAEPWCAETSLTDEDWLPEWSKTLPDGQQEFTAAVRIVDEQRKLDIRSATPKALEKLGLSPVQIQSALDWMDSDNNTNLQGAEDDYYMHQPLSSRCKNADLEFMDELAMARGFSLAERQGQAGGEEADEADSPYPIRPAEGLGQPGWYYLLRTVGEPRKININTAPQAVLETLPLSPGAVEQIIGYRRPGAGSADSLEGAVFRTMEDVEHLQGLTETDVAALGVVAAFRSTEFRIYAETLHAPSRLRYRLEVLVHREPGQPIQVMQWKVGAL